MNGIHYSDITPRFAYDQKDAQRFVRVATTRQHVLWLLMRLPDLSNPAILAHVSTGNTDEVAREEFNAATALSGALTECPSGEQVCIGMRHRTVAFLAYDLRFRPRSADAFGGQPRSAEQWRKQERLSYQHERFLMQCEAIVAANAIEETDRYVAAQNLIATATTRLMDVRLMLRDAGIMTGDDSGTIGRALASFDRFLDDAFAAEREIDGRHFDRAAPKTCTGPDDDDDDLDDLPF